jgi:lipopolysaccharide export system protein LptC
MQSRGRVNGAMRLGQFQAGRLSADLDERTVRLEGGVRLKIYQGAVR